MLHRHVFNIEVSVVDSTGVIMLQCLAHNDVKLWPSQCEFIHVLPVSGDSSVGTATELRAGRSGDRIPVGARFSVPVQTGPGA